MMALDNAWAREAGRREWALENMRDVSSKLRAGHDVGSASTSTQTLTSSPRLIAIVLLSVSLDPDVTVDHLNANAHGLCRYKLENQRLIVTLNIPRLPTAGSHTFAVFDWASEWTKQHESGD